MDDVRQESSLTVKNPHFDLTNGASSMKNVHSEEKSHKNFKTLFVSSKINFIFQTDFPATFEDITLNNDVMPLNRMQTFD